MKKLLKREEYPKYIGCLAQCCLGCPILPTNIKYAECKNFSWKQENKSKYELEVENGYITKVWERISQ